MPGTKQYMMAAAAILLAALPVQGDELFHNGGTGRCTGCHTTPPALIGSDPSSTCLFCHQAPGTLPSGYYVASSRPMASLCVQLSPGGDFCWLRKDYRWGDSSQVRQATSLGERHGHNIVALDFGYGADTTLIAAPGGSYPGSALSCISCHDPHGNYRRTAGGIISTTGPPVIASGSYTTSPDPDGNGSVGTYRLLAGKGYQPKYLGGFAFTADPPAAVAPTEYNRGEAASETRVAYGSGMSEWCENCHIGLHNDLTMGGTLHPAGIGARLPGNMIITYDYYISSGNLTGVSSTAYTSLVPFEMGTGDYTILKRTAGTDNVDRSGPQNGANVMCLTCHRAHASAWDSIMRWNMKSGFLVYNGLYPGVDNYTPSKYAQGRSALETQKGYYDRPPSAFSMFQRSLCNKCHAKD